MKKRKKGIIYWILFCLFFIWMGFFFKRNFFDYKIDMSKYTISIQDILDRYSNYVIVTKEAFLYEKSNNTYEKIAVVESGVVFELEKIREFSLNTTYFQINDSNYYIYYQNISPLDSYEVIEKIDYTPLNSIIETNDNYSLIQTTGEKITFFEANSFAVEYLCDDGYVVKWQDELYKISSSDVKTLNVS